MSWKTSQIPWKSMYLQTLKELLKEGVGQIHLIILLVLFQNVPFTVPKRGPYSLLPTSTFKNKAVLLMP
jgi:hypothetical protein